MSVEHDPSGHNTGVNGVLAQINDWFAYNVWLHIVTLAAHYPFAHLNGLSNEHPLL